MKNPFFQYKKDTYSRIINKNSFSKINISKHVLNVLSNISFFSEAALVNPQQICQSGCLQSDSESDSHTSMGHGCIGLIIALNGLPRSQVGLLFRTRTLPSLEEPCDHNQLGQNIQQTQWKKYNFLTNDEAN